MTKHRNINLHLNRNFLCRTDTPKTVRSEALIESSSPAKFLSPCSVSSFARRVTSSVGEENHLNNASYNVFPLVYSKLFQTTAKESTRGFKWCDEKKN